MAAFGLTPDQHIVIQAAMDAERNGPDIALQDYAQKFLASVNEHGFVVISIRELNEKRNESYAAGWDVGFSVAKSKCDEMAASGD